MRIVVALSSLLLAYSRLVAGDDCPIACVDDPHKVCGTDGVTYNSKCQLKLVQCSSFDMELLEVAHDGPCDIPEYCKFTCEPSVTKVCGSDFITYDSFCELERAQCISGSSEEPDFVRVGECGTMPPIVFGSSSWGGDVGDELPIGSPADGGDEAPIGMPSDFTESPSANDTEICPPVYFPVCATDGLTYNNLCSVLVAHLETNTTFAHRWGDCDSPPVAQSPVDPCSFECPLIYQPVCLPGIVFENMCTFAIEVCRGTVDGVASEDYCAPSVIDIAKMLNDE